MAGIAGSLRPLSTCSSCTALVLRHYARALAAPLSAQLARTQRRSSSSSSSRPTATPPTPPTPPTAAALAQNDLSAIRTLIGAHAPRRVRLMEVGPRDGLQNEQRFIPTAVKAELVDRLSRTGLKAVEAASFVRPDWVPQMRDGSEVMQMIERRDGVVYPVLVPNVRGYESAREVLATHVAVFTSASESFAKRNTNCTIEESFDRITPILERARFDDVKVRGYVSCVVGCPEEGPIDPAVVARVAARLYKMGCYEISLGDTIGVGTPGSVARMLHAVLQEVPVEVVAGHFHDTFGMALSNILTALELGVSVFDSSVAGLGGCPYARGATGNVATEDVVYMLHGMGIDTGVDLDELISTADFISRELGRNPASRVATALLAKKRDKEAKAASLLRQKHQQQQQLKQQHMHESASTQDCAIPRRIVA